MTARWATRSLVGVVVMLGACSADPTSAPLDVVSDPAATLAPEPAADGGLVFSRLVAEDEWEHIAASVDGTGEHLFAPVEDLAGVEIRALSPDGSQLAVVGTDRGVLVGGTLGVDGSDLHLDHRADPSLQLACAVWAPGGRMACEGWDDDPSRAGIYTVRASDGGDPLRLTTDRDVPCDYSPDALQLAFVRTNADGSAGTLMVMRANGTDPRPLLENVAPAGISCDWSPDGRTIVAGSADGRLMLVTPDGDATPLLQQDLDAWQSGGVWSPDGAKLAFSVVFEDGQGDVYTVAADGSAPTPTFASDLLEESAVWIP